MGLSSSQARLLNLTSRMHQIEYKAAKLEAEKLQMANESRQVYNDYLLALEKTKIQSKILSTDGSITFIDTNYQMALENGYLIRFMDTNTLYNIDGVVNENKITIQQSDYDKFNATKNKDFFIAVQTGRVDENGKNLTDGYQEIYTEEHLKAVQNNGENYRLMSDINVTSNWTSLNISGGTFDGNGHTISGLNSALFNDVRNSTVRNINVNGDIEAKQGPSGILANKIVNKSTVENVNISGTIDGGDYSRIGSLAGYVANSTISQCSATNVSVKGNVEIGGFIGFADAAIIKDCSVTASVYGETNVGGFIGSAKNCEIKNSTANAQTTIDNYLTQTEPTGKYYTFGGGFAGYIIDTTITSCNASGSIENHNEFFNGGLSGFIAVIAPSSSSSETKISNCTSSTNIINNDSYTTSNKRVEYVGGMAGDIQNSVIFTNCDYLGTISTHDNRLAGEFIGGVLTLDKIKVDNCYAKDSNLGFSAPYNTEGDNPANISGGTSATNPNNNNANTKAPNISTTIKVSDENVPNKNYTYGVMYDKIASDQYIIGDPTVDPTNGHKTDNQWFSNMISEGFILLYKPKENNSEEYYALSVSTDTNLQEVSDESLLKKAEAKYEADMKKIDMKDRKYDTDLAALDAERNAIKQEMETLKTIAKENVERTFRLFS